MKSLKYKLLNKKLTIGTWLTIPSQSVIEILATANFEWICIDTEHSHINTESLLNLIAHIKANDMHALVRVSKNEEVIIKKVLDAGADGIIVPMINSSDDCQRAINYIKYPPIGKRGVGLSRAQNYGIGFKEYKNWLENEIIFIAQIEHKDAVKNIDDILKFKYLDGIIIGPYDLSASMGLAGDYNNKLVKNMLEKVHKSVSKSNKSLGFHVIESDYNKVLDKIKLGYNLIAFSLDFFFLGDHARKEMKKLNTKL